MIKLGSIKVELDIPFNILASKFDLKTHCQIIGCKYIIIPPGIIEQAKDDIIEVRNKYLYYFYKPTTNNKTELEYYTGLSFLSFMIFVLGILLVLGGIGTGNTQYVTIGFPMVFWPLIRIISGVVGPNISKNKIITTSQQAIKELFPNLKDTNINIDLYRNLNQVTSTSKLHVLQTIPPPVNVLGQDVIQVTPPPLPAKLYFININGVQKGPFERITVKELLEADMIKLENNVWREGMSEWQKLETIIDEILCSD